MAKKALTTSNKDHSLHVSFGRINYYIMIAGLLVLVLGYVLMGGGKQSGAEFNEEEIYSFTRITLAPILVVLGFIIEIVAIFYRPKSDANKAA